MVVASERERGGRAASRTAVRGHVALHPATVTPPSRCGSRPPAASPDGLAVVSRLFTDRAVPGTGVALLQHAVEQAQALGRAPVLQVDPDSPARAFYGRRGWTDSVRAPAVGPPHRRRRVMVPRQVLTPSVAGPHWGPSP